MSDYTHLIALSSQPPASPITEEPLCDAQYMIPVFWYALFDGSCVQMVTYEEEIDDEIEMVVYPRLVTPTVEGLKRAEGRRRVIAETIGRNADDLFAAFAAHVRSNDRGFLCCETLEWSQYLGEEEPGKHLSTCLRAFEVAPFESTGFLLKRRKLRAEWAELFGQANLSLDGDGLPLALSLCGKAYTEPAPWRT